jgi:hypothetical protein
MAYQLQPGLKIVKDAEVQPKVRADDQFFAYPQGSRAMVCGGCRPNTMLYGTPARFIDTDDELRPQSTTRWNRQYATPVADRLHPIMDVHCKLPVRAMTWEPVSSRAEIQNAMFHQRYVTKK